MRNKCAIITGSRGQDGSYLSELLLDKGYEVIGVNRRSSSNQSDYRIQHLLSNPKYISECADITDSGSIRRIVKKYLPNEFFNLAAQSHVGVSFNEPYHTFIVNAGGVINCLEAIRDLAHECKFYQASTSELYGKVQETPQTETTPFYPRSPYGVAKLAAYWSVVNYRESYGLFACNGILFNHESPRRGIEFVTRKITDGVAKIKLGLSKKITLGNLDAKRDWGHAKDYCMAMWLMLQQDKPRDFVISSGETRSIEDLLRIAFSYIGIKDWQAYIEQNPEFMRPAEVDILLGDSSMARKELGWRPVYTFESMIHEMIDNDLERLSNGMRTNSL